MKRAIYLIMMILVLASCKSTKQATKVDIPQETKYLSAKMQITAPLQSGTVTLNGTLKLKTADRMQLSVLMPILRTELFRMELSDESCMVVDRVNHRYALLTKEEMSQYLPSDMSYTTLEKLMVDSAASSSQYELTGKNMGLPSSLEKAKVLIYDISDKEFEMTATSVSSKYTRVTTAELLNMINQLVK